MLSRKDIKVAFTSGNDPIGDASDDSVGQAPSSSQPAVHQPASSQQIASVLTFILLGGVLIAAASMKALQVMSEPVLGWSLTGTVALICFELTFGLWLVLGNRTVWTHRAALACFSTFAMVAAYKVFTGAESCGCFGAVKVSPSIMLVIDLGAVLLLCLSGAPIVTGANRFSFTRIWLVCGLALPVLLAINTAIIVRQDRFVPLATSGLALAPGEQVVLNPEKWTGQKLPLFEHMDPSVVALLSNGDWDIVLFKHGCHVCHTVLEQLERSLVASNQQKPIALIAIDEGPDDDLLTSLRSLGCVIASLNQTQEWFATTPTQIQLSNGVCKEARVIDKWQ